MPSETCQFREKPGSDPVCKVMTDGESDFCPRHRVIEAYRQQQRLEKERKQYLERKHHGSTPKTRRELIEQGYQYTGNGTCRRCEKPIEWWRTPNMANSPWDPMADIEARAVSHFATCLGVKAQVAA